LCVYFLQQLRSGDAKESTFGLAARRWRDPWLARLMDRRPIKVAAVALANKIARMAWVMIVRGERFEEPKVLPGKS
jgi:hypothetical protein